jgi:hypothetical protein
MEKYRDDLQLVSGLPNPVLRLIQEPQRKVAINVGIRVYGCSAGQPSYPSTLTYPPYEGNKDERDA